MPPRAVTAVATTAATTTAVSPPSTPPLPPTSVAVEIQLSRDHSGRSRKRLPKDGRDALSLSRPPSPPPLQSTAVCKQNRRRPRCSGAGIPIGTLHCTVATGRVYRSLRRRLAPPIIVTRRARGGNPLNT